MVVIAYAWVIVSAGRVDNGHALGWWGLARTTHVTVGAAPIMPVLSCSSIAGGEREAAIPILLVGRRAMACVAK